MCGSGKQPQPGGHEPFNEVQGGVDAEWQEVSIAERQLDSPEHQSGQLEGHVNHIRLVWHCLVHQPSRLVTCGSSHQSPGQKQGEDHNLRRGYK